LFQVGLIDNLVEMQAVTKEQRQQVLKDFFDKEGIKLTDVKLQELTALTEHFAMPHFAQL
jgi:DNA replication protein DnaD